MRLQVYQTCGTDAADASPEARMPNGLHTHWNEQMALELALEVSRMQEMTLLLARVRFPEQTPRRRSDSHW